MPFVEDSARSICEFSEARDRMLSLRVVCRMFLNHANTIPLCCVAVDHAPKSRVAEWYPSGFRFIGSTSGRVQHLMPKCLRLGHMQGTQDVQRLVWESQNPFLKCLCVYDWQPCPEAESEFPLEAACLAVQPACNVTDLFWYNSNVLFHHAMTIITQFSGLVSLKMRLTGDEMKECSCELLQLKALAALPLLREFELHQAQKDARCRARGLDWWVKNCTLTGVAKGLTSVVQLRRIDWSDLPFWSEDSVPAVVTMLSCLHHLIELRTLYACGAGFWEALLRGGGHKQLQRLRLMYFAPSAADLQAMALSVTMCMPKLDELTLAFYNIPADYSEFVPHAHWKQFLAAMLAQLRSCSTLQRIQLEETGPAGLYVVDENAVQAELGANGPKLEQCETD